jgi:hypothetical protein
MMARSVASWFETRYALWFETRCALLTMRVIYPAGYSNIEAGARCSIAPANAIPALRLCLRCD